MNTTLTGLSQTSFLKINGHPSNKKSLLFAADEYQIMKKKIKKTASLVALHQKDTLNVDPDELSNRKVFHVLEKFKQIEVDNKRFLSKINKIIDNTDASKDIVKKFTQLEKFKRAASQRQFHCRQTKLQEIDQENKRLKERLRAQKSQYVLNSTRGMNESTMMYKLPAISQRDMTPRIMLLSRDKDYESGKFIEKQASKLLIENRQVIFKKTVEIPIVRVSQKCVKQDYAHFIIEVSSSNVSKVIFVAAFDILSQLNFLMQLKDDNFKIYLSILGSIDAFVDQLFIKNDQLKLKKIKRNKGQTNSIQTAINTIQESQASLENSFQSKFN
ncbi:UNKNOWN [Stylonychia lemnae]|uniref:Uncharacterized protein n=1 Tax=Stylonychia lemnae TaxID=5949 RepID=A0A078ABG5_STYLE|nr:UNKNOWN [Stylonychia lemnae]|eukprot:CDW78128.1 UNKNOWN [Stylonychia lemnae]